MDGDIYCKGLTELLRTTLASSDADSPLVVSPTGSLVEPLAELAVNSDEVGGVRLFTTPETAQDIRDQVPMATRLADILATESEGPIRHLPEELDATLVILSGRVVVVTQTDGGVAGLVPEASFAGDLTDLYESAFKRADHAGFRAPPRTAMLDSLASALGEEFATEVDELLAALEDAESVSLSEAGGAFIIVGARHGIEQYQVRRAVEDVGFASQATLSRRKSTLEEAGIVQTHTLPADVGRPREELDLTDEFAQADLAEFVDVLLD